MVEAIHPCAGPVPCLETFPRVGVQSPWARNQVGLQGHEHHRRLPVSSPAKAGGLGDRGQDPAGVVGYPLPYSQVPLETSLGPDVSICGLDLGSRISSLLSCLPASCLPCPGPLCTAGTRVSNAN